MSILTTLNPLTNADRLQMWCGAFRYLGKAEPLFAVSPVVKINLVNRKGRARSALKFAGNVIGGAAFILLAFAFVALLGLRMGAI